MCKGGCARGGAGGAREGVCLDIWDVPWWGQKARLLSAPLLGLQHWEPHIEGVGAREVCAAHTTAPQENTPPPVGQRALVVEHLNGDDGVVGEPVVHCWLHVGELGVEGVLCPGHMAGLVGSRDLHQRVGQIIGLERHCYACRTFHGGVTICVLTIV